MEGNLKFQRGGGGVFKANFLQAMYENKVEFPRGGTAKQKTFHGGVWMSPGTVQLNANKIVQNRQSKPSIIKYIAA